MNTFSMGEMDIYFNTEQNLIEKVCVAHPTVFCFCQHLSRKSYSRALEKRTTRFLGPTVAFGQATQPGKMGMLGLWDAAPQSTQTYSFRLEEGKSEFS